MSTEYHRFKSPISSVRVHQGHSYAEVSIFIKGQKAGVLNLNKDELPEVLALFQSDEVAVTTGTRDGVNRSILACAIGLTDESYLISEYGEVISYGELLARAPVCEG